MLAVNALTDDASSRSSPIAVYQMPCCAVQGRVPDYNDPVVIKSGSTVEDFCLRIHKSFVKQFKHALVWGSSVKHRPQKVTRSCRRTCIL